MNLEISCDLETGAKVEETTNFDDESAVFFVCALVALVSLLVCFWSDRYRDVNVLPCDGVAEISFWPRRCLQGLAVLSTGLTKHKNGWTTITPSTMSKHMYPSTA